MNIKIDASDKKFKCRVAGVLIVNNKLLVVQIMDNGFYCLPGGHCNIGEDTKTTIQREMQEETSIDALSGNLLSIVENFFTRSNNDMVHELSFIYKVENKGSVNTNLFQDRIIYENDEDGEKKLEFKWIPLDEINDWDIRPIIIKDIINSQDFSHYIITNGKITKLS